MKLLFVEPNGPVQNPTVESLRSGGVGAFYARSINDAQTLLKGHAASMDALVVHDSAREWAEKTVQEVENTGLAWILVSKAWGNNEFLKHQNGKVSANAYLRAQPEKQIESKEIRNALDVIFRDSPAKPVKAAPISIPASNEVEAVLLEDVSEVLNQTRDGTSITFDAPQHTVTGIERDAPQKFAVSQPAPESTSIPSTLLTARNAITS